MINLKYKLLISFTILMAFLTAGPLQATMPEKIRYESSPFMTVTNTVPQVLLVLSKDHKMFYQAYNNLADLNGDGVIDSGFNPSITYYGYFDPKSCYKYTSGGYSDNKLRNWFERDSLANTAHQQATNPTRPAAFANRGDISIPASANGVCLGTSTDGSTGLWHGNWLNYAATSRMDAIRKVLYGGKRYIDTNDLTVLDASYIPRDVHVWGVEYMAEDLWAEKNTVAPYYDISYYTPFEKPANGRMLFFGRVSTGDGGNDNPSILYVVNVNGRSTGGPKKAELRIWDWVTGEVIQPYFDALGTYIDYSDSGGTQSLRKKTTARFDGKFAVRVKVCDSSLPISESEGCQEYPNGNYKPVGLLQQYGAGNKMYFGLMSGIVDASLRYQGGALRQHIDSLANSVDFETGLIKSSGIINTIDKFRITGHNGTSNYNNFTAWGTPMGEMLYEAVRYMAGRDGASYTTSKNDDFGTIITDWKSRPLSSLGSECTHPSILLISDVYPDYDGDNYSGAVDLNGKPAVLKTIKDPPAAMKTNFLRNSYLDLITANEGFNSSGKKYFYAASSADDCLAKSLTSLSGVKGLCPSEPAREGTYTIAATAYYAHTRNLNSAADVETSADFYAVAMSASFPEITFDLGNKGRITVLPTSESQFDTKLHGFLNYFIMDWQTDSNGIPFYIRIVTNFEDQFEGADNDRDALATYEFRLLTKANLVNAQYRTSSPLRIHSGELKDPPNATTGTNKTDPFASPLKDTAPTIYYGFENYKTSSGTKDYTLPKITINPDTVVGFAVTTDIFGSVCGANISVGYTISGTTHDGTYMDAAHASSNYSKTPTVNATNPWPSPTGVPTGYNNPTSLSRARNSPWSCPSPGQTGCGTGYTTNMKYYQTRAFLFSTTEAGNFLPDPLWLAAKYGGFKDNNNNGKPDPGEWEGDVSNPAAGPSNYFKVSNINQLAGQLDKAFRVIGRNISTSTATSASVNSILGGGIAVHTAYYPEYVDPSDDTRRVRWVGTVYGLFMDKYGNLREDTDGNQKLKMSAPLVYSNQPNSGDYIVTFNSVDNPPTGNSVPACYNPGQAISVCADRYGDNNPVVMTDANLYRPNIHKLKSVWDAGRWLAELDPDGSKLLTGSRDYTTYATNSAGKRRIYYGTPLTGSSDGTMPLFNTSEISLADLNSKLLQSNFAEALPYDSSFGAKTEKLNFTRKLVEFIQGAEVPGWRSRRVGNPWASTPATVTWRMGDVLNSKPIVVGAPAFHYDLLYGDASYAAFSKARNSRRHVVYFGSNDGMLHALNIGYYGSLSEGVVGYLPDGHDLGAEIWAYIPTSVLPHLQWLADPDYVHSYFVDMKPQIADIRFNSGWKTVLIGGLRLGGRPIKDPASPDNNPSYLFSEVFALDVTDPAVEPKFLWRYSAEELGLMVGLPTVVSSGGKWYVVLASGPRTDTVSEDSAQKKNLQYGSNSPYDGYSNQRARLIVLDAQTGQVQSDGTDNFLQVPENNSFFGDPHMPAAQKFTKGATWDNHAVYYGLTVSRDETTCIDSGAVYRLQMVSETTGAPLAVNQWKLKRFYKTDRPVTGAVNSTYDSNGNLWVLFATGRIWGFQDLTPCTKVNTVACKENHEQYLFGIKEDLTETGLVTFKDMTASSLVDVTGANVYSDASISNLGVNPAVTVGAGGTTSYASLYRAMISRPGPLGYKRKLDMSVVLDPGKSHNFEVAFTQPKVAGLGSGASLTTFTSFEPSSSTCGDLGYSYLYILDTFTGLPSPDLSIVFYDPVNTPIDPDTGTYKLTGGFANVGGPAPEVTLNYVSEGGGGGADGGDGGNKGGGVLMIDGGPTGPKVPVPTGAIGNAIISWREALDTGFSLSNSTMVKGLQEEASPLP